MEVNVLAITFERGWIAEAYVRETSLTWPLLIDETRELYAAYGMSAARHRDLFGPAASDAQRKREHKCQPDNEA